MKSPKTPRQIFHFQIVSSDTKILIIGWVLLLIQAGCQGAPSVQPGEVILTTETQPNQSQGTATLPPATPTTTATFTPTATVAPTATPYPTPDLSPRPLVWFSPMPPLKVLDSRPFTGSDDFMQLFMPEAAWAQAAEQVHVFKLYGEWVEDVPWTVHASDAELEQVIQDLSRRGIALAVEMGPLDPTSNCGQGIEGFATIQAGVNIARRIRDAGGTLRYVAFDEPFAFASIYDGPNACQWSAENVAQEVLQFEQAIQAIFPQVIFGDTEPLWSWAGEVEHLQGWIDAYQAVTGKPLGFLHLDLDFRRADWAQDALALETYAREHGVEFGMIYMGDPDASTDEAWLSQAGERVLAYETEGGGQPDHILFQSWHDHPDRVLPETEPYTWTWFISTYFGDRSSLGYRREGSGANLALGKAVIATRSLPDQPPSGAVDGSMALWWGAGDFPMQWIQIDLGQPETIGTIRLVVTQYPAGDTIHQIWVGASQDQLYMLHSFEGYTVDGQVLEFTPDSPLENIQFIRVITRASPSWVGWQEIEVLAP